MTAAIPTPALQEELATVEPATITGRTRKRLTSRWASLFALVIAVLWTIPTFGLLLTSLRPEMDIRTSGWWTWFSDPQLTLANYDEVLYGGTSLSTYFVNSIVITIPSVVIPVSIACLASYAFAWMKFPMRDTLFVAVFALQIVPLQVALIPLLRLFVDADLNGTFWPLWISHTIFALPLAIFLLHNFFREVPGELMEAARVDGAGHVTIFLRIMLPLVTPAIAAFAIFQFLWVWNDLLVAITMATGAQEIQPLTARLAELSGSRGSTWHLLSAGAFVSIVVPVIVFVFLQRYFVRGLLAGSVKG
ncbi:carbohydrate ABC transporter permease [Jiangella ureilytica]|uniref:Carbohydrate ABC transporter permease n=1 Tax=Jiangella ureilytica TaxID=2530374 RepID=A0A4R4S637_9ACTN|nr:carbohydrate ABC transporter permease [Jiangella ureilytica]TDC56603.1 carbohydrate ABC transporter permease [Jiangella ureilytica]